MKFKSVLKAIRFVVILSLVMIYSSNTIAASRIHRLADDRFQLRLSKNNTDQITILQVTDQHLGKKDCWRQDLETCRRTQRLVEQYNPDLIAVTGDLLTGEKYFGDLLVLYAMEFFDGLETPWLYVFGNHDPEGGTGHDRIYEIFSTSKWGMLGFHTTPDGQRKYDYRIDVFMNNEQTPQWEVYNFDSGSKKGNKSIKQPQLDWYQKRSVESKQKYKTTIPAVSFFHIPLKDHQDMWDDPAIKKFGECEEKVCYEEDDGSVYQSFLNVGNVKACFCGHDHYNNYWGIHHGGILLAYGHISGEATNYNWPTGGKLITLSSSGDIKAKNVMSDSVMKRLERK